LEQLFHFQHTIVGEDTFPQTPRAKSHIREINEKICNRSEDILQKRGAHMIFCLKKISAAAAAEKSFMGK